MVWGMHTKPLIETAHLTVWGFDPAHATAPIEFEHKTSYRYGHTGRLTHASTPFARMSTIATSLAWHIVNGLRHDLPGCGVPTRRTKDMLNGTSSAEFENLIWGDFGSLALGAIEPYLHYTGCLEQSPVKLVDSRRFVDDDECAAFLLGVSNEYGAGHLGVPLPVESDTDVAVMVEVYHWDNEARAQVLSTAVDIVGGDTFAALRRRIWGYPPSEDYFAAVMEAVIVQFEKVQTEMNPTPN